MTTTNPRPEKVAVVTEVAERLEASEAVVLTEYRGLDVTAMAALRGALREVGGEYKVYKNTLVRLAAAQVGLDIDELLVGPTALAFVGPRADGSPGDPAAVAKALSDFAKGHEALVIKGGVLDTRVLSTDDVKALASLPSREQLFAELAGAMEHILADFAGLLDAKLREFVYGMEELLDAGGPEARGSSTGSPSADDTTTDDTTTDEADTSETASADTTDETSDDAAEEAAADADEATETDSEEE